MENKIKAQRVSLDIDFQTHSIQGRTRIKYFIDEQTAALGHISLFCKQVTIVSIKLAGSVVQFETPSHEAWVNLTSELVSASAEYDQFMQVHYALWDLEATQGGLLKIILPPERKYSDTVYLDIEYSLTEPAAGLVFYRSVGKDFLVSDGLFESVRCWLPCDDSYMSSYSFGIEVKVPEKYTVVASGQLQEIVQNTPKVKTYRFLCEATLLISTFGLCIGELEVVLPDPQLTGVTHFCVNRRTDLQYTICNNLFTYASLVAFLTETTGLDLPFHTQNLVFLPNLSKSLAFSSLAVVSDKHLFSPNVIDGQMESMRAIAAATAYTWFGGFFSHQTPADIWLVIALQIYLSNAFFRAKCGYDELRYHVLIEMQRYCHMVELGEEFRPLSSFLFSHPNELLCDPVFLAKAPLVLHMIESTIGKEQLVTVIKQVCAQGRQLATALFIKAFKKTCGISLNEFSRYWIYGTGAPHLECSFEYKPKLHAVELTLTQRPLLWSHLKSKANAQFTEIAENDFLVPMRLNQMRVYKGPLTVIIHETDKFEKDSAHQVIFVEGEKFTTLIPCKKPIRKTTNTKRRDDSDKRKLYETLESPVLWIRVDPDFEVLRRVKVVQSRAMWYQQMEEERDDPIGQIEAMQMLSHDVKNVSLKTFTSLYDLVKNPEKHYLVRTQACKMMAALSDPSNGYKGLDLLVFYYQETHFDKSRNLPLPNSFSSRSNYLVDKAVLEAITSVKDMSLSHNFKRLRVNSNYVTEFLIDLLRFNDNSSNGYEDGHWRGWLLEMICSVNNPIYIDQILEEVLRQMKLDVALKTHNQTVLQHAILGFVKTVDTFEIWDYAKTREIWEFLDQVLATSPEYIQEAVLKAMTHLMVKERRSPAPAFQLLLKRMVAQPMVLSCSIGVLEALSVQILSEDVLVTAARDNIALKRTLWGMLCSPYACLQHYFRYGLANTYRLIYGYDWGQEMKDSAWQAHLEQPVPGFGSGEGGFARHQPLLMEEGSLEPVDISAGDWRTWALCLIDRMMNHEFAEPFNEPVDHVKLGLRDYLDIVKHPMDFATIKAKLERLEYGDFLAFCSDVQLVFDNCRVYNMEGSLIYSWAETIDSFFQILSKPIKEKIGIVREDITKVKLRLDGSDISSG